MNLAFQVNFTEERSIYDEETLASMAVEVGLYEAAVRELLNDGDAYAEDVRADERQAAELGAGGVPFFMRDRQYGVAGLQSVELFTQALEPAWQNRPAARH